MSDYEDYKEWVEVTLHEQTHYFQSYDKLSPQELFDISDELVSVGISKGLEGCYVKLLSTTESYEDWLGEPIMVVIGYRRKNEEELADDRREAYIRRKAKELGVVEHIARDYVLLEEMGLVGNDT